MAAIAVSALAALAAWLLAGPGAGTALRFVERRIGSALGGEARLGRLELRLWRLEARFHDLRVTLPAENGRPLQATVEQGTARLAWSGLAGLAGGRIHLRELDLRGAVVGVESGFRAARVGGAERRGPLDLRIDRLRLRDAALRLSDREAPLDLDATQVLLTASWSSRERALVGEGELTLSVWRPPLVQPLPLEVRTAFLLRSHELELRALAARAPGVELELDLRASYLGSPALVGRGSLRVDLQRLGARMAPDFPQVRGSLEAPFSLEMGAEPLRVRGRANCSAGRFGPFEFDHAAADVRYSSGRLELWNLEAATFGGRFEGAVEVGWREGAHFSASGFGYDLSAARLLEWAGLPLPVASRLDAQIDLEGTPADRSSWNGHGRFSATAIPLAEGRVPAEGSASFTLVQGGLELVAEELELPSARIRLELEADLASTPAVGVVRLGGRVDDAAEVQAATLTVCKGLGIDLAPWVGRPLDGAGRAEARIVFGGSRELSVEFDLTQGAYAGQPFESAWLQMDLNGDRLVFGRVGFDGAGSGLQARADLDLEPLTVRALELRATRLDPAWILDLVGFPLGLSGDLDAEFQLDSDARGPQGAGWVRLGDGRWQGERFDELRADVEIDAGGIQLHGLRISGPAGTASGDGRWDPGSGNAALVLESGLLRLGDLQSRWARDHELRGLLELQGRLSLAAGAWQGAWSVDGSELSARGQDLGAARGGVALGAAGISFRLSGVPQEAWAVEGRLALTPSLPFEIGLRLHEATVDLGATVIDPCRAELTGDAVLIGNLLPPHRLKLRAGVDRALLVLGSREFETQGRSLVTLEAQRLSVGLVHVVGQETDLELQVAYDLERDELDSGIGGYFDLGLVRLWLPEMRGSGRVELAAQAVGPIARPDFSGALRAEDARIRWIGFPQALDELSFTLRLDRQQAELLDLRARLGNGEIRGEGGTRFVGFQVGSSRATIHGANVQLRYPEGFRGVYEGRLEWNGAGDASSLSGQVELLRGVYDEEFKLGLGAGGPNEYSPVSVETLSHVALDVAVASSGGLWVRNEIAQLESNLDIHIGGTLGRPEVTGRLWVLEGGKLVYRGVDYQIRNGSIDLVETDRFEPYLVLEADTVVEDYTILLRVEGTLDRLEYELSSEPPLGTEDIIALLTTGNTLDQFGSTSQSGLTRDLAANYFAGAVTDRLGQELRRVLKLSRLRVDPLLLRGEADPTTRVTVGQEVADDLFVIFSAELGGDRERKIYQMEWRPTGKLGFTAERDSFGGVGGSVRYRNRFWWKKPSQRETAVPANAFDGGPLVKQDTLLAVEVEGLPPEEWAELRERIPVRTGLPLSRSAVFRGVEALRSYYVRRGWLEARVDARIDPEPEGFRIVFEVDLGEPVLVTFEGVSGRERRRLRTLLETYWAETVFSDELYEDSTRKILDYFHDRGFYAADVFFAIAVEDGQRTVSFHVDRGEPVEVTAVTFHGGDEIPDDRVREQMLTRPSSLFTRRLIVPDVLDDDLLAIRNLYRDEGYLATEVEPSRIRLASDGKTVEIGIHIEAGPRHTVAGVRLPDAPFPSAWFAVWAELEVDQVYSRRALLGAESRVQAALDERGYPDAQVRGRAELEGTRVHIELEVEPGSIKQVQEVVIRGNDRTRTKIIRRELEFEAGDLVSREKLLAAQQRLNRLGIFRGVRVTYEPAEGADPAAQRVEVEVEESAPISTHVGLGYDSEVRARLNFALTDHNLGGYDRVLSVQGRLSSLEQRFALVGREPRLFTWKVPSTITVAWEDRERDGFQENRVGGAVRVDRDFTPIWAGYARYGLDRVRLSDVTDPSAVEEEKLENLRLGSFSVAATRMTYDNPFSPTQGAVVGLAGSLFARPLASQASFLGLNASAAGVHSLRPKIAFAGAARVGLAFPFGQTDQVPISERFFAGGSNSMRGFARDRVGPKTPAGNPTGGEALFLINTEFRFPIWRQFQGVLFYDVGNVYAKVSDMSLTELRHVLGAGVRLVTPIGPFRLEYGRKLDREEGESAGEFYLSIGYPF